MKRLYLMITITNRVVGSGRFVDFYRAFGAPVVFTALGRGTASDDVLSRRMPDARLPLDMGIARMPKG